MYECECLYVCPWVQECVSVMSLNVHVAIYPFRCVDFLSVSVCMCVDESKIDC